jgi:hypothetical protein
MYSFAITITETFDVPGYSFPQLQTVPVLLFLSVRFPRRAEPIQSR